MVLDIEGGRHGARIITYPKHGGDNQLWTWRGNSLVSKSGYAMDIKGGNTSAGASVVSWDHHGGSNQQWRVEGGRIISMLNGMVVDIKGGSKESNADIILWPAKEASEGANQTWQFVMHF